MRIFKCRLKCATRSPIVVIRAVLVSSLPPNDLGLGLAQDGRGGAAAAALGGVGWSHEIAGVVDDVRAGEAPLQHLGGELVRVVQIGESHDVILGLGVLDDGHGGDHLDPTYRETSFVLIMPLLCFFATLYLNRSVRNGHFSALILQNFVSMCFGASSPKRKAKKRL